MSEEMQARTVDLFFSGEQQGTYGEGPRNHGIGLATLRTLVGKLKGTARVESPTLGKRTTFAFTIAKQEIFIPSIAGYFHRFCGMGLRARLHSLVIIVDE